jgi:hypothetical protein
METLCGSDSQLTSHERLSSPSDAVARFQCLIEADVLAFKQHRSRDPLPGLQLLATSALFGSHAITRASRVFLISGEAIASSICTHSGCGSTIVSWLYSVDSATGSN